MANDEKLTAADYTATGAFDTVDAGENKSVTVNVTLSNTTKANNYTLSSGTFAATGEIKKADTTITTAPTASGITYGQALSDSTLSGGVGSVPGTFAWTNGTDKPSAGAAQYEVTFTPTDTVNYNTANEFVEKIVVHERDRKGSIDTTQEVEIYFNFVGRYVPPHFGEVNLTPEEQEALRKKEERKDKLHQNYLCRKASGAQKRYEDKIRETKKAEIEAKKAAIRAENMAKGVFTHVRDLPRQEPRKSPGSGSACTPVSTP